MTLLIVDDELYLVRGLMNSVRWEEYGIDRNDDDKRSNRRNHITCVNAGFDRKIDCGIDASIQGSRIFVIKVRGFEILKLQRIRQVHDLMEYVSVDFGCFDFSVCLVPAACEMNANVKQTCDNEKRD